ncbi:MAG: N-acetyl-gamma-glutamyl-phosphate reductase [Coriobacteriales bacterium]|jgi:N-acetyl-gamma-glutamyl-phosphate reductase|nr:N-acetyl-gamma-glutamyl-phosphate reductase [Coriobacteriales bacterium]
MPAKRVAVIGAAGYAGIEVVRHLLGHPSFELLAASSDSEAGVALAELYPALLDRTALTFISHKSALELARAGEFDAVFLAVPHTVAVEMASALLEAGVSVFDLSADFRLKDAAAYAHWYGTKHAAPELLKKAIYGLPELYRAQLAGAEHPALVACPGCYPTASALAAAPALAAGLAAEAPVIVNAISGVSGAGRRATDTTHFCSANDNVNAYGATTHRHTPEIAQTFSTEARRRVQVVFTPHLAPLKRGLLATATLALQAGVDAQMLQVAYLAAYGDEPFVQLLPFGTMPRTASVLGGNSAHVGIAHDEAAGVLVACCAIDNLGKGAASQAVQCANIVFGFHETLGLSAVAPVV